MPEVIEPRDAVIEPRTSMTLLSLQMARLQAELSTRGGGGGGVGEKKCVTTKSSEMLSNGLRNPFPMSLR